MEDAKRVLVPQTEEGVGYANGVVPKADKNSGDDSKAAIGSVSTIKLTFTAATERNPFFPGDVLSVFRYAEA